MVSFGSFLRCALEKAASLFVPFILQKHNVLLKKLNTCLFCFCECTQIEYFILIMSYSYITTN